jgi:hypothetical protein
LTNIENEELMIIREENMEYDKYTVFIERVLNYFKKKESNKPNYINKFSRHLEPLHFPLLFLNGEEGYYIENKQKK